jgi:hypothetical protein
MALELELIASLPVLASHKSVLEWDVCGNANPKRSCKQATLAEFSNGAGVNQAA